VLRLEFFQHPSGRLIVDLTGDGEHIDYAAAKDIQIVPLN